MHRSIRALAAAAALPVTLSAAPALGQVIEIRMTGSVLIEVQGDPQDSGLDAVHIGDPLVVVARIDLSQAGDLLPESDLRGQYTGPGVDGRGQAGIVALDNEVPTVHVLGDVSSFGGPLMDQIIIHGGSSLGIPVHAFVMMDPSVIATDELAAGLDVAAPELEFGQITLSPYLATQWGDVTRITIRDVTCPADLAPPFGSLDFSDVTAFLGAFATGEPAGDPAAPLGVFDFSDVVEFLAAFGAGCP